MNIQETSIYQEILAFREEVLKHKWYESEKAGYDIGWTKALIDWSLKYKSQWVKERKKR